MYDARYVAQAEKTKGRGSGGRISVKDRAKDDEDMKLLLLNPRDGFSAECLLTYEREAPAVSSVRRRVDSDTPRIPRVGQPIVGRCVS